MADAPHHTPPSDRRDDPFYVGYLPTPPSHLRTLRVVLPIFSLLIVGCGVLAAGTMPRAQTSVWDTGELREWTGTLRMDPYPRLLSDGQGHSGERGESLLLVEMGKFGVGRAHERPFAAFANGRVRVRGYYLERDGRRMIELDAADDAISAAETSTTNAPAASNSARSLGAAVVRGEVVDFKCYLGAMRPGEGLTHRACAQLCVSGGIPPVLVSLNDDGSRHYELVVGASGEPLNTADAPIIPIIGRPVEIRGERYEWDGLTVLRAVSIEPVDGLAIAE